MTSSTSRPTCGVCRTPAWTRSTVTRPWRDGGRDAVGDFLLGPPSDPVAVEFALEAKCYAENHGVGVRETSRLISRLRHRQFGVLVTTSHLDRQAYREIREDGHPVVVIAGRDLVDMLKDRGFDTRSAVIRHLHEGYPSHRADGATRLVTAACSPSCADRPVLVSISVSPRTNDGRRKRAKRR